VAAQEGAAIVEETLKDLLVQIRTPERTPSPVDVCITEEELFHRKNPKVSCVIQRLHSWHSREGEAVGLCPPGLSGGSHCLPQQL